MAILVGFMCPCLLFTCNTYGILSRKSQLPVFNQRRQNCCKKRFFSLITFLNYTALLFLRGHDYDVQTELESFQRDSELNSGSRFGISGLFKIPHLRWGLFIALIPHFGQQLSGINGVLYYSVSLFESVGLSNKDATLVNLGVGVIILLGTIVSVCIIDRGGRRVLLLVGFSVCLVSLVTFTTVLGVRKYMHTSWLTYISILLLYLFVSGFSFGPGT